MTMTDSHGVSEALHCSTHKVSWLRENKLLPGVRFGKHYLYDTDDIQTLINVAKVIPVNVLAGMSDEKRFEVFEKYGKGTVESSRFE